MSVHGVRPPKQHLRWIAIVSTGLMHLGVIFWSLVAVAILYYAYLGMHRISLSHIKQLQVGMTKVEVIAILGKPFGKQPPGREEGWYYLAWDNGMDPYYLWFDDSGKLVAFP